MLHGRYHPLLRIITNIHPSSIPCPSWERDILSPRRTPYTDSAGQCGTDRLPRQTATFCAAVQMRNVRSELCHPLLRL
jgi:hypothetical protein